MSKLKIAHYWAAACGGCDVAMLDLHEKILDVANAADILFWPIAVDGKVADVEALEDGELDVTFFNGAVRNSENEEIAHLLRKKSKIIIAFGSCASIGGIPGLANFYKREDILNYIYKESPSTVNEDEKFPKVELKFNGSSIDLPEFYDTVKTLNHVVDVDYFMPGCPPAVERIEEVVQAIVSGDLPPKGSFVGVSDKSVCDDCPRVKEEKKISSFKRISLTDVDPERCLLEQGIICLGSVTRGGCGSRCIKSGVACRGCYGPMPDIKEQGAKLVSAVSSIIDSAEPEKIVSLVEQIKDPLGTFYRFGLSASILGKAVEDINIKKD